MSFGHSDMGTFHLFQVTCERICEAETTLTTHSVGNSKGNEQPYANEFNFDEDSWSTLRQWRKSGWLIH
jgi:hypothetical protein